MSKKPTAPVIRDFYANTQQIAERFNVAKATIFRWVKDLDLPVKKHAPNSPYMVSEKTIKEVWIPILDEKLTEK